MGKIGKTLRELKENKFKEKVANGQIKYYDEDTYKDMQVIHRCMDIHQQPSKKDRERFEEIVKELKPFAEKIVEMDSKQEKVDIKESKIENNGKLF